MATKDPISDRQRWSLLIREGYGRLDRPGDVRPATGATSINQPVLVASKRRRRAAAHNSITWVNEGYSGITNVSIRSSQHDVETQLQLLNPHRVPGYCCKVVRLTRGPRLAGVKQELLLVNLGPVGAQIIMEGCSDDMGQDVVHCVHILVVMKAIIRNIEHEAFDKEGLKLSTEPILLNELVLQTLQCSDCVLVSVVCGLVLRGRFQAAVVASL